MAERKTRAKTKPKPPQQGETASLAERGKPHRFQKGNQAGLGNRGPSRPDMCTQVLISLLNEVDKKTGKAKVYRLCETLIDLACGYTEKRPVTKLVKGKLKTANIDVYTPPDKSAIAEVIDRVQGKATQQVIVDATVEERATPANLEERKQAAMDEADRRGVPQSILMNKAEQDEYQDFRATRH